MRRALPVLLSALSVLPAFGQPPACPPVQVDFPQKCLKPTSEQLELLARETARTPDGGMAGLVVTGVSTGAAQNAKLGVCCPQLAPWCPEDSVLLVKFEKPVLLWHVAQSPEAVRALAWFARADARTLYTKAQAVSQFAYPDCWGWPPDDLQNFGQPNPVPQPPDCRPLTCPQGRYTPGYAIQWAGAAIVPAGTEMAFGYVGPNMWGPGGELQWFVFDMKGVASLPVEPWPGE